MASWGHWGHRGGWGHQGGSIGAVGTRGRRGGDVGIRGSSTDGGGTPGGRGGLSRRPQLGSPTALADPETERRLRGAAERGGHTLYVPRGALWGCEDIRRMDEAGTLAALKVTMTKAPQSFRLEGRLRERLAAGGGTRSVLYEGPLRPLCPLAPNNVNTMAAAAVAAPRLGFDGVRACLVADPSVPEWHIVEVEVTSVGDEGRALRVTSTRRNPAVPGAVTGKATRDAFWSSLLACHGHGGCVQLC
ncbi:LOW QUALITY PROTEIN: aspartate dehydrogenase domain-containing protein [Harpia harpyja]|uniref:LOW QUALITY PROTEIN: aspartate dehydrogenase domain-containing protein n=1 Tax=Harpia harpyja TaxID=202280 RepID=UPI0022B1EB24|nr:LOW QUALITY PROTEIN: aspartate dehydrogenase domain-containing protein [Harpia harpyja]